MKVEVGNYFLHGDSEAIDWIRVASHKAATYLKLKAQSGQSEGTPVAYEFHDGKTGHCYVDYVRRSDIEQPDGNYKQTPLYYSNGLQQEVQRPSDELEEANKIILHLRDENRKFKFMIDNGLGWEDMRNDISMPHEI